MCFLEKEVRCVYTSGGGAPHFDLSVCSESEMNMKDFKRKVFDIIEIGTEDDKWGIAFDAMIVIAILSNLFVTLFETFDASKPYMPILEIVELVTIIIFTIEYALRIWTAEYLYPGKRPGKARVMFIFSAFGIIDLLTFFPFYLPFVFPAGAVAFRILRVVRILRLFRINSRYDDFNVIMNVLKEKRSQILSSVSMVLILMVASSLTMYSLEHEAQPEQFRNAFSGIWWSVSTLLTIGYGDIYPVTMAGKFMAIIISFLGVGMVAIPTGIISAGFVEQYSKIKTMSTLYEERRLKFFTSHIPFDHPWCNQELGSLVFPPQHTLLMVQRDDTLLEMDDDLVIKSGDMLLFGTNNDSEEREIRLKEVIIKGENKWIGHKVKDMDISQKEKILMIGRNNKIITPKDSTMIKEDDCIIIYSR